jgi:hypothetical protein
VVTENSKKKWFLCWWIHPHFDPSQRSLFNPNWPVPPLTPPLHSRLPSSAYKTPALRSSNCRLPPRYMVKEICCIDNEKRCRNCFKDAAPPSSPWARTSLWAVWHSSPSAGPVRSDHPPPNPSSIRTTPYPGAELQVCRVGHDLPWDIRKGRF